MSDEMLTMRASSRPPKGWQEDLKPAVSPDYSLVRQIREVVNQELNEWAATLQQMPSRVEQRRRAEDLITSWLEQQMLTSVSTGVSMLTAEEEQALRAATLAEMFGLGRLEALLAEDDVEDIYIAGTRPVIVKLADGRRELREPIAATVADLMQQLESIATHQGQNARAVSSSRPWLNLRLPGEARLAAMWDVTPVPYVTIRRHRFVDITLDQLVLMGMLSPAMSVFLKAAVLAKRSILVVGAQYSGKTTFLRGLCRCLPETERFVTLESEFELLLHEIPGQFPGLMAAEEREGMGELGVDGRPAGEVSIGDLFPQTLRHSLDRCIVGEVRGSEVGAVLDAMTRGYKGSMATFHADSASETVPAMAALMSKYRANWSAEAARYQIAAAVDLVVFIDRERIPGKGDHRFVSHILEINGVSEQGRVIETPIFAPLDEYEGVDPRGYLVGQPEVPKWWRRVGLDVNWLQSSSSGWPEAYPTVEWR